MTEIRIKRVYEAKEESDGFRVLVDRLWPRGVKKENLHYDLWAKEITPSTSLRRWFRQSEDSDWEQLKERYFKELEGSEAIEEFLKRIEGKPVVTLLYASRDTKENNALALQIYLQRCIERDS